MFWHVYFSAIMLRNFFKKVRKTTGFSSFVDSLRSIS